MSGERIDCMGLTNTYYSNDDTNIIDLHNDYAVVPYSIALSNKFTEKSIPYVKIHFSTSQLSSLEFDDYGEVSTMSAEIQLESIQKDIKDIQKVLTEIQCSLTRIETKQDTSKEEINKLRSSTEDLPAIRNDMNTLKDGLTGWKQYILSPVITGAIVGIFLLLVKLIFHVQ